MKDTVPIANDKTESETLHMAIGGMSCASCVANVEKAIESVEGVDSVLVNLADRSALINGSVDPQAIVKAVQQKGFDASELTSINAAEIDALEQQEHHHLLRLAAIAGAFGLFLMLGDMLLKLFPPITQAPLFWGVISVLTLTVMVYCGGHFYKSAYNKLRHGTSNMDTLIALGTGAAWLYSTAMIIWPTYFPARAQHGYFEAAVVIIALVNLGQALEMKARGQTSRALKNLLQLQPQTAVLIDDEEERIVPVASLRLEDVIKVVAGERIAADGLVQTGQSYVDESLISGESMPIVKEAGMPVYGGSINQNGVLTIEVTSLGMNSVLGQIIKMVQRAQSSKPRIAKLVDKIAAIFVPVVVLISIVTFVIWLRFGPSPQLSYAFATAMTVLVIACPCALGLATPISIVAGVGRAADNGILIKNGDAIQTSSTVDTVVLDKTGTITAGQPAVTFVDAFSDGAIDIAISLERDSNHPLAKAIIKEGDGVNTRLYKVSEFNEIIGKGVNGVIEGVKYSLGSPSYITNIVGANPHQETISRLENEGQTVIILSNDEEILALFAISDPIKKDSAQEIEKLKQQGLNVVMLTGDAPLVAKTIAAKVGIDVVHAGLSPQDKLEHVMTLQQQGHKVMMVGDGINDAPALTQADVGVAIGAGTDVAIAASDITIIGEGLGLINEAINTSKKTIKTIHQNLFGAFIYNIVGIPIAAGVLYPSFGILLSPMFAATAMAMSSLTVVLNAARLASNR